MTEATPGIAALDHLRELKPGSFVFEQKNALSSATCADMIRRFEAARHEQYPGRIGQLGWEGGTIKRSTDLKDMGYAIQRTRPGEYYHWHIDGGSHQFMDRQLVAIWYLNDVAGPGGATEFEYQELSVRPEQGKLLLFPPFWTHRHRGTTRWPAGG